MQQQSKHTTKPEQIHCRQDSAKEASPGWASSRGKTVPEGRPERQEYGVTKNVAEPRAHSSNFSPLCKLCSFLLTKDEPPAGPHSLPPSLSSSILNQLHTDFVPSAVLLRAESWKVAEAASSFFLPEPHGWSWAATFAPPPLPTCVSGIVGTEHHKYGQLTPTEMYPLSALEAGLNSRCWQAQVLWKVSGEGSFLSLPHVRGVLVNLGSTWLGCIALSSALIISCPSLRRHPFFLLL